MNCTKIAGSTQLTFSSLEKLYVFVHKPRFYNVFFVDVYEISRFDILLYPYAQTSGMDKYFRIGVD